MAVVCACRDCSSGKADDRANASKKAKFAVLSFFAHLLPLHHFLRLLLRKMQKVSWIRKTRAMAFRMREPGVFILFPIFCAHVSSISAVKKSKRPSNAEGEAEGRVFASKKAGLSVFSVFRPSPSETAESLSLRQRRLHLQVFPFLLLLLPFLAFVGPKEQIAAYLRRKALSCLIFAV
uniref:Transmembrane protein n=1 Tax=Trichuris muris TaxID=70415 RepID=A0A5S6Q3B4_TRIMR